MIDGESFFFLSPQGFAYTHICRCDQKGQWTAHSETAIPVVVFGFICVTSLKLFQNTKRRIFKTTVLLLAKLERQPLKPHKIQLWTLCAWLRSCMCVCASPLHCLSFWQASSLCLSSCKANLVMYNPVPVPACEWHVDPLGTLVDFYQTNQFTFGTVLKCKSH